MIIWINKQINGINNMNHAKWNKNSQMNNLRIFSIIYAQLVHSIICRLVIHKCRKVNHFIHPQHLLCHKDLHLLGLQEKLLERRVIRIRNMQRRRDSLARFLTTFYLEARKLHLPFDKVINNPMSLLNYQPPI